VPDKEMRDYALLVFIAGALCFAFRRPFVGLLLWVWFTCQQPHQEAWGLASTFRLNLIIVIVTVIGLLISKERKWPQLDLSTGLLAVLLAWMTIVTFVAVYPEASWPIWDRTWRTFALAFMIAAVAVTKVRIHAIMWIVAGSLMYYGVKGGVFTIQTGGNFHVYGPPSSIIGDNNHMALALLMTLPLANYLRRQSQNPWIKQGMLVAMILCFVSVLGSYSRGAYIAMAALAIVAWWHSKNRLVFPMVVAAVALPLLSFMPQSFYDRINTIGALDNDSSFQGRLDAWYVAYRVAIDYFPFGAGFYAPEQQAIFTSYVQGVSGTHAAHSIYFQVLGENGFIGLALYLAVIFVQLFHCWKIMRVTRNLPEWFWAHDLAAMVQLSLFAFCVGGAALSMAYYDVFVLYSGILSVLHRMTKSLETAKWVPAFGGGTVAEARLR
jgi:putative inorganic carbon (hco3(-)) transporter